MKNVLIIILVLFVNISACKTKEKIQTDTTERYFFSFYRSGCYGTCQSYKITIEKEGSFEYFGKSYVNNIGKHKGTLTEEQTENLFIKLASFDWMKYQDEYPMDNYDFPQFTIEYSNTEFKKTIRGNSNTEDELIELTKMLDSLIKTLTMEKVY